MEVFQGKLAEQLRDGETLPDPTFEIELVMRAVETALEALSDADFVYCRQGGKRKDLRRRCLAVARNETYPELVDVRRAVERRYGREAAALRIHRIEGPTLRKPRRQQPQLEAMVKALRRFATWPEARRPVAADRGARWLAQLKPGYDKLTAMLAELDRAESMEAKLREDRDFELESFDVVYAEALALVRAVFLIGGRDERILGNLLPTVQRRRLKGKARQEREAYAEGLRDPTDESSHSAA